MRNNMPPDGKFDVFLEKAKFAFRKDRQRKKELATAERQAAQKAACQRAALMNAKIFTVNGC